MCKKHFTDYLNELKKACETDLYIKKTNVNRSKIRKSSNIQAYINWFNRLSSLCVTEIVKNLEKEKRIEVIEYFIDVAFECFQNSNYNSALALIASLNSFQITRLKRTVR
jgi:hypothetical protein